MHKMNHPGRPEIFSINPHTTKLSKYVDHNTQPLTKEVKSQIRDTTDFLNKISDINAIPQDTILVTTDGRSNIVNQIELKKDTKRKSIIKKKQNKKTNRKKSENMCAISISYEI